MLALITVNYAAFIFLFLVAARSKAWVCGRSPAEIMGSNPTGGMDIFLLCIIR